MRILVTGSREFTNKELIKSGLLAAGAHEDSQSIILCHGGAVGADRLAKAIAEFFGWNTKEYLPDWEKYGKAAGVLRNRQMVDEFKPDVGVAFYKVGARNIGTMDCVKRMLTAGIPVHIYPER